MPQPVLVSTARRIFARSPARSDWGEANRATIRALEPPDISCLGLSRVRHGSSTGLGALIRRKRRKHLNRAAILEEAEPATRDAAAVRPLAGVSFTPAGLLFPYYVGVSSALQEMELITQETRFAGSSAGAIMAVFLASGLPISTSTEAFHHLLDDIAKNGTVGRLGAVLRRMLIKHLPEDIASRASGRVTIGMTDFGGFRSWPFSPVIVSEFTSKEDLVDAVCASCHIPGYLGPTVGSPFRGKELSDGAVTAFLPKPLGGASSSSEMLIAGVSAVAATALGKDGLGQGVDISPDLQEKPPFSFFKLTRMGLLPCTRTESDQLHRLGYDDAVRWAQANGRGSLCREGSRPGASFP